MAAHDAAARAVKAALVRGDVSAARQAAGPLVALSVPIDLESPAVERARKDAERVAQAANLTVAAHATASMLVQCGSCHAYVRQKHPRPPAPPPDEEGGVVREMTRHAWALDRMWDGVLWSEPEAVKAAAAMLNAEDLVTGHGAQALPEALRPLEAQLHGLAVGAQNAVSVEVQAALLGDMLTTCGACHAAAGVRP